MNFGEKIKRRRNLLGISAEELAEKVNVSPATIYRYENGEIKAPRQNILSSIAKVLNDPSILTYDWDDEIGADYIPALDDTENMLIEKFILFKYTLLNSPAKTAYFQPFQHRLKLSLTNYLG